MTVNRINDPVAGAGGNAFGRLLKEYRRQTTPPKGELEITQTGLAQHINYAPSTLNHWEEGRSLPGDAGVIVIVCAALGLTNYEEDNLLQAYVADLTIRAIRQYRKAKGAPSIMAEN